MNQEKSVKFLTPRQPVTKRDILTQLYTDFQLEINKHIDLSHVFPSIDEIPLADLVFNITFIYVPNCNIEIVTRDIILMQNITITEEKFQEILPIIKLFLLRFHSL